MKSEILKKKWWIFKYYTFAYCVFFIFIIAFLNKFLKYYHSKFIYDPHVDVFAWSTVGLLSLLLYLCLDVFSLCFCAFAVHRYGFNAIFNLICQSNKNIERSIWMYIYALICRTFLFQKIGMRQNDIPSWANGPFKSANSSANRL